MELAEHAAAGAFLQLDRVRACGLIELGQAPKCRQKASDLAGPVRKLQRELLGIDWLTRLEPDRHIFKQVFERWVEPPGRERMVPSHPGSASASFPEVASACWGTTGGSGHGGPGPSMGSQSSFSGCDIARAHQAQDWPPLCTGRSIKQPESERR